MEGVCHLPMYPAFCEETRKSLIQILSSMGVKHHTKGTCVAIEGPRFSSRAESNMFRSWNADVINMTTCPEVLN
jgi:5'-methylthioadenosine phosphorylase